MLPGDEITDERDFQRKVGSYATGIGVLHYHTHDSRRSESGFPDSTFVGRRLMMRELKMTTKSRVRPDQKVWLQRLSDAGIDAGIWYADDYYQGVVQEQLDALTVREPSDGRGGRPELLPPMALRVAKRLYVASAGPNTARSELLWDAGVNSVRHGEWIAQAHETLALVADELPHGATEHQAWLAAHDLGADDGLAALLSALESDLKAHGAFAVPG
jgi:hypothetical protein